MQTKPTRRVRAAVLAALLAACTPGELADSSDASMQKESSSDTSWCGDGRVQGDEECEEGDLGGWTCTQLGYGDGVLRCGTECAFDTALCLGVDVCGNGLVDGDEECDDGDVLLTDCAYGETACEVCTVECTVAAGRIHVCGDGVLDGLETCDGDRLGSATCESLGYDGGEVACGDDCRLDPGGCVGSVCGNGIVDDGEACDDGDDNADDCPYGRPSCETCRTDCTYGAGTAHLCGDGVLDTQAGEVCDGANLGDATCESRGFAGGGTLTCSSVDDGAGGLRCMLDFEACVFDGAGGGDGDGGSGGCATAGRVPAPRLPLVLALVGGVAALARVRRRVARTREAAE